VRRSFCPRDFLLRDILILFQFAVGLEGIAQAVAVFALA